MLVTVRQLISCRRFATQRVRHMNVTENLSVSVRQTFATVPLWKIRHTTVIGRGGGGWVGRVGVRGVRSGGWGWGVRVGGLGSGGGGWGELGTTKPQFPDPTPPTPRPQLHRPQPPRLQPPQPNLPPPIPIYHHCVVNLPHQRCY